MGKGTHKTKDGRTAKKGLYYYINKKRKEGRKMRKKGAKGAPTAKNFKDAAKTAKKSHGGALHGGQKKLDKNKDGKISGADFKMMKDGGQVVAGNANRRRSRQGAKG
jgi:hypothetical protein|tara:strand:- start:387 stop:707 length:321 start_codon:yes stop_codon:yes gene_type:complete